VNIPDDLRLTELLGALDRRSSGRSRSGLDPLLLERRTGGVAAQRRRDTA
jgi:hypothetical protein